MQASNLTRDTRGGSWAAEATSLSPEPPVAAWRTRGGALGRARLSALAMNVILVTGGAGFIGSNFVRLALARTDSRVVVLDKLTYAGNLASLRDVATHPRFTFVHGDIADRTTVEAVF